MDDLYLRGGAYEYSRGFNWKAVGACSWARPWLWWGWWFRPCASAYDYSWFVGFVVSFVAYYLMMAGNGLNKNPVHI